MNSQNPASVETADERAAQVAGQLDAFYLRQVERLADKLETAAARVRQEGTRTVSIDDRPNHVLAAASAIQEIWHLLGNLNTDSLISAANDAQNFANGLS